MLIHGEKHTGSVLDPNKVIPEIFIEKRLDQNQSLNERLYEDLLF